MSPSIDPASLSSLFFVGILGSGMSALAQYARLGGCDVAGSDRLLGSPDVARIQRTLAAMGCRLCAQDGSGVDRSVQSVIVSTAIEESNPDISAARRLDIPILHRSDFLAACVAAKRTVAVAGTSGKSTVTALVFELLDGCGRSPSLITGAEINRLCRQGSLLGNAWAGQSDLLVIEADESDGSLVKYRPSVSVILNVSKDHKPVDETVGMFDKLAGHSKFVIANADDPALASVRRDRTFGLSTAADFPLAILSCGAQGSTIRAGGATIDFPLPGRHNAANLAAALCVCEHLGCTMGELAAPASRYEGIRRRFTIRKTRRGIPVVDDYAHNPEKIIAALETAHLVATRVIALFQPHGFAPARFLRHELAAAFAGSLAPGDLLVLLPIYYAGGTASHDISSEDIAAEAAAAGAPVVVARDKNHAVEIVKQAVRPGDCVISMGARDPGLDAFAAQLAAQID